MSKATDRNRDNAPLGKKIEDLYALIDGIEIAMFTTRRPDGHLVSRPMATQTQAEGTDLWFVTDIESNKLDELGFDPQVNLSYYRDRTREWVSVSGTAMVSQDRMAIHELYQLDWKMWFGDEGGEMDGGPDDPRLALLLVNAESAVYATATTTRAGALVEMAKSFVKGEEPDLLRIEKLEGGSTA